MYRLNKPSDDQIRDFIDSQDRLELTYPSIGATRDGDYPAGFVVDHHCILLGSGQATFDLATRALRQWKHFQFDWIELHRPETDPAAGQTVAVLAHALGLWVLNACQVIYVIEEQTPLRRFVFAYGTLPDHAESGEERFQIEWHPDDDSVWYDILAFSRPHQRLSRLAYPYARFKQKQFAADSLRAMKAALTAALPD